MFKIKLQSGRYLANKQGRVQHYNDKAEAKRKIERLGARGKGAKIEDASVPHRAKAGKKARKPSAKV